MQFAVMGAGAVGSVLTAALIEAEQRVEIIGRPPHVEAVKKRGLIVENGDAQRVYHPRAVTDPSDIHEPPDVIILSVKSGDLEATLRQLRPWLARETLLLACQNGMILPTLAKTLGAHRVAGAVIGWGASLQGPGHVIKTSPGSTIVGTVDGQPFSTVQSLTERLSGVDAILTENILGHLWMKLLINASLNPVSGLSGFRLAEIAEHEAARMIIFWLWRESCEVARALSIPLEKFAGRLEASMLYVNDMADWIRATYVVRLMARTFGQVKSSMWQDLDKGKSTEVDFLNGHIVREGKALGLSTPIHDAVLWMIHEIEQGKREIGVKNLTEIEKIKIFGEHRRTRRRGARRHRRGSVGATSPTAQQEVQMKSSQPENA